MAKEMIYRHSFMWKKHMLYYPAKNMLIKEGFSLTGYDKDFASKRLVYVNFSDGISYIKMGVEMVRNKTTNKIECGNIMSLEEWSED